MTMSAIGFALILTALQQPAYGDDLVVAAGDEYATNSQVEGPQLGDVEGPPPVPSTTETAGEGAQSTPEDKAEFQRLFGSVKPQGANKADRKVSKQTAEMAWPWWVWPVGLLAIGVLLIVRGRINKATIPVEAIKVVSRQAMGKEGTLALIEVHDGDSRKRRLLVGLGGGAPRLVADVSAWEVAVAAPSNIANDAVAIMGPDPEEQGVIEDVRPQLRVAPKAFETHLAQAADRVDAQPEVQATAKDNKADLIEEVLAQREQVRRESADVLSGTKGIRKARRKPTYSSREVVA